MKKFYLLLAVATLFVSSVNAQDKPFRIGVKLGIPNIAGLNAEYVTPLLGEKLAGSVDFSYFSVSAGSAKASLSYFEIGANYYFIKEGKGLYGNLSYGRIGAKLTYDNLASEIDPTLTGGSGEAKVGVGLINIKLGAKLGGLFYFRPELGYAIGAGGGNVSVSATFPDGSSETIEEDVPGLLKGGVVGNIGFGFAF